MKTKQVWVCMGIGLLAWAGGMAARGDDAAKNGSSAMNPSEEVDPLAVHEEKNGLRILLLGNSITLHEYYPSIGWTNEWGMAASAIEKDYAHLFIREIERKTGRRADWRIRNIATFERFFETYDCAKKFAAEYAYSPDIVVLAVGENMRDIKDEADERLLGDRIQTLLRPFAEQKKKPLILVRGVFWPNDRKDAGLKRAADACGAKWVPTGDLGQEDENLALGKFAHAGVAHHPGDLGMARIAQRLAAATEEISAGK